MVYPDSHPVIVTTAWDLSLPCETKIPQEHADYIVIQGETIPTYLEKWEGGWNSRGSGGGTFLAACSRATAWDVAMLV